MSQTWIFISFIIMLGSFLGNVPAKRMIIDEICDNAIDDDNDGLIDLNDPDCICEVLSLESLIPNPSFEDYDCCPKTDSELNCATGWSQASGGTTDYVNTCDYLTAGELLLPFPDGEGAILFLAGSVGNGNGTEFYKEYAGACLDRTMQKDSVYRLKFHLGFLDALSSPEIRFSFFGSPSCNNLPFSLLADCPTDNPQWHFLNAQLVSGNEFPGWVEVSILIKPSMDIDALVLGDDCSLDSEGELRVYFIDNLRLNDESSFDFELIQMGSPCNADFAFAVAGNSNFSYQWYKAGVALVGETGAKLSQMYDEGSYQLRIINNTTQQCRLADEFEFLKPVFTNEVYKIICEGEELIYNGDVIVDAGVYDYSLATVDGCDSLVTLSVELQSQIADTLSVKTLVGTSYSLGDAQFTAEGVYYINLTSSKGCDSTVVLQLEHIDIFIPNIFSPNGDGTNDTFEVYSSDDEFIIKELSIFDRWGNLLHSGNKWDGRFGNKLVNSGVYVYYLSVKDLAGQEIFFTDSFTLIR